MPLKKAVKRQRLLVSSITRFGGGAVSVAVEERLDASEVAVVAEVTEVTVVAVVAS